MVFPGNGIMSLPVRIDTYFCDDRFDIRIYDVLCNIRFSRRVANRPDLVEAFPGTDLFFRFFPCQGGSGMPFLAACLMAGLFPAVIGIGWFSALLVCRRGCEVLELSLLRMLFILALSSRRSRFSSFRCWFSFFRPEINVDCHKIFL